MGISHKPQKLQPLPKPQQKPKSPKFTKYSSKIPNTPQQTKPQKYPKIKITLKGKSNLIHHTQKTSKHDVQVTQSSA